MPEKDYDESLHCAHTSAIFAVENTNPKSKSFGRYFWMIFPVFDNRYKFPAGAEVQDGGDDSQEKKGTGMFIYSLDGSLFWEDSIFDGRWHTFSHDILPYIRDGFDAALRRSYLEDVSFNDMKLKSFNFGWEITGNFDASMKIRRLSGKYTL